MSLWSLTICSRVRVCFGWSNASTKVTCRSGEVTLTFPGWWYRVGSLIRIGDLALRLRASRTLVLNTANASASLVVMVADESFDGGLDSDPGESVDDVCPSLLLSDILSAKVNTRNRPFDRLAYKSEDLATQ